jgi:hypothetical protein
MAVVKRMTGGSGKRSKKKDREDTSEKVEFALATEASEPSTRLGDYIMLLFGEKKIGKTTLASLFDKAYFVRTESGTKALRVYGSDITSWDMAKAFLKAIRKDKRFGTVVIDTIDMLYRYCEQAVCRKLGIDDPSEEEWGRGWRAIRSEFEPWLAALAATGKGLILISHANEQEIKTRTGERYHKVMPTMPKQARDIIEAMVDIWACYTYDGRTRVLILRGDDHVSAGHRLTENFRTPDGEDVEMINMGHSAEEAHKRFVAAFNNRYVPDGKEERPVGKKTALKKAVRKRLSLSAE